MDKVKVKINDWADTINEHVGALHEHNREQDERTKELMGALELLSQNSRALWDTIDLLRGRINDLENSIRNSKGRCWPWS